MTLLNESNTDLETTKCQTKIKTENEPTQHEKFVAAYADYVREKASEAVPRVPYFVTTVFADFNCNKKNQLKRKVIYAWNQYDYVYRHLTSKLMNNFSKKKYLHPITIDFVDLPFSRHTKRLNVSEPQTPHIHSVYLLHPDTLERFKSLREDRFSSIVHHPSLEKVISIDAQPFPISDTNCIISYSSKLLENYSAAALSDEVPLFNQFPIADFERENRRSSNRSVYQQFSLLRRNQSRTREHFYCSESTNIKSASDTYLASTVPKTSSVTFRCSKELNQALKQTAPAPQ